MLTRKTVVDEACPRYGITEATFTARVTKRSKAWSKVWGRGHERARGLGSRGRSIALLRKLGQVSMIAVWGTDIRLSARSIEHSQTRCVGYLGMPLPRSAGEFNRNEVARRPAHQMQLPSELAIELFRVAPG